MHGLASHAKSSSTTSPHGAGSAIDRLLVAKGVAPHSRTAEAVRRSIYESTKADPPTFSRHPYGRAETALAADVMGRIVLAQIGLSTQKPWHAPWYNAPEFSWLSVATAKIEDLQLREVRKIVDGISNLLDGRNFQTINFALERAEMSKMSVDALVAIARITYLARNELPGWAVFVEKAREIIVERGEDVENLEGLS